MKTASLREDWEGRTINGRFALLEWLGGAADYGVFLTIRQGAQKAAIKVILADGADADAYVAQWEAATTLSHPHLLRVLEIGQCDIDGVGVVYVVTEHGDVALSRILADEPIGASEAIEVIDSLLDVLSYLHGKGIVHGHVNPSNILFVGDEVKLAGGDFLVAEGVQRQVRKPATCDAPEVVTGKITAAADVWSVGMVLAEAMTQRSPRWDWAGKGGPIVPDSLPQPFFDIVQGCLRLDPARRFTIPEIKARLGNEAPPPPAKASTANASLRFAATKPVPQQVPVSSAAAPIAASAQPATPPAEPIAPPPGAVSAVPDSTQPASAVPVSAVPESKPAPNPLSKPVPSEPIPAPAAPIPALATPIPAPAAQLPAPVQPVSATPAPPPISAPPLTSATPIRPPERAAPQAERRVPIAEPRFGYEEPDDYLRPPTLFASAEVEPRRFRLFPTLIGVLVVFAFIAFLLERSNPAIFSSLVGTQKATTPSQTKPQPQSPPPSSTATQPEAQTAPAQTASSQSPAVPSETQSAPAPAKSTEAQPARAESAPAQPAPAQSAPAQTGPPPSKPSTDESSSVPMTGQSVPPVTRQARASSHENSRGAVARQVLPSVSPNARRSMRRPMEISVLVSVDRNGTVTSATYGSYGPGNYFARIAVRAAHDWTFTPPMLDGRPESSFWTLHFFFDRARTEATAQQDTR